MKEPILALLVLVCVFAFALAVLARIGDAGGRSGPFVGRCIKVALASLVLAVLVGVASWT